MDSYKELLDFLSSNEKSDTLKIRLIKEKIDRCINLKKSDEKNEIMSFLFKLNLDDNFKKRLIKLFGYNAKSFYDMNMIELKLYLDISKDILESMANEMIHEYLLVTK